MKMDVVSLLVTIVGHIITLNVSLIAENQFKQNKILLPLSSVSLSFAIMPLRYLLHFYFLCIINGKFSSCNNRYHVPQSFLRADVNTLVLFGEFGGNPSHVNFKTVGLGGACATPYEGSKLELSCNGRLISAKKFASFGNPLGSCGSFVKGSCEGTEDALDILTKVYTTTLSFNAIWYKGF